MSPRADELRGLPRVGEIFDGKYRIDGVIGIGGMGVVLSATHLCLEERVAIKLLLPQWSADKEFVARFLREGRASIKIRSEHVVRVLDVGLVDEQPYLVLEYLVGNDFEAVIEECGPLHIPDAVDCLLQACEALAEAHVAGVVHRDLKPANLFLTHRADLSPCVKVLDFGISKVAHAAPRSSGHATLLTLPNTVMGSPPYMSPEQMESSKDADERSDIWSIGVILHELIAGKPPFTAETVTALCACVLRDPPPRLTLVRADVALALETVVLRCLEKDPADRFANVAELARALAGFGTASALASAERISRIVEGGIVLSGSAQPSAGDSFPPHAKRSVSLRRPPLRSLVPGYLLAGATVLLLGGGFGWALVRQGRALHAAESRAEPAQLAPAPQVPLVPAVVAAPATTPLPISQLTTTAAIAGAGPSSSADAGRGTVPVPPRVEAEPPPAATAAAPPRPHRPPRAHRVERPPVTVTVSKTPDDDNPFAGESAAPPAPPAPAFAPAPAPVDPSTLFEGRK